MLNYMTEANICYSFKGKKKQYQRVSYSVYLSYPKVQLVLLQKIFTSDPHTPLRHLPYAPFTPLTLALPYPLPLHPSLVYIISLSVILPTSSLPSKPRASQIVVQHSSTTPPSLPSVSLHSALYCKRSPHLISPETPQPCLHSSLVIDPCLTTARHSKWKHFSSTLHNYILTFHRFLHSLSKLVYRFLS